ncbi:MAG TPA: SHOCT domain-containing protein [Symbiobacteriaceae bacterium]|nr:SHOCT domain-containing protein [Symbiobacteriaceae bacterium]
MGWLWLQMLFVLLGLAAVVALPWVLLRRVDRQATGIAVLKRRLAAGEISTEEYTERLALLKQ